MLSTFVEHLNLSADTSKAFLSLSLADLLNSPEIHQLLGSLDTNLLRESLPIAKTVLSQHLPPFYEWLQSELGVQRVPDSPDHTTKWVVGFLQDQESLTRLIELHRPVPRLALERSIPWLVGIFKNVEPSEVRQEWQKAIAALCMVLVVAAREQEPLLN